MGQITTLKLKTEEQKITKTVMDTIMVDPVGAKKWLAPSFQRPVKENSKVLELAEELKRDGGVWPGVVTLGVLKGETYLIDGQHRRSAFLISGLKEGYVDVRIHYFNSAAEMGEEFVNLNSQLARMGPDDILRGLEPSITPLQIIRKECPFVGYDNVRRSDKTPIVSMSVVIRAWRISANEIPAHGGGSAKDIALAMTEDDAHGLCKFLNLAIAAFGRDPQYYRLWGMLNLGLTMWLYRRIVIRNGIVNPQQRRTMFTPELFTKCMMALSADPLYLDWLHGRVLSERDRAPAYSRIRAIFVRRATPELGKKVYFPASVWISGV